MSGLSGGVLCPACGSSATELTASDDRMGTYRCSDCGSTFSGPRDGA